MILKQNFTKTCVLAPLQHSEIWPFSLFKTQFQTIKIHEGHISENMAKLTDHFIFSNF